MDKPHLKKLEDRSRMLVHLGTEPGSKAYRPLDPQVKKIIVSRDVVFDETKGWNWTNRDTTKDRENTFEVTSDVFKRHGLEEIEEQKETENNLKKKDHVVNQKKKRLKKTS